jgi:hypothetical protein
VVQVKEEDRNSGKNIWVIWSHAKRLSHRNTWIHTNYLPTTGITLYKTVFVTGERREARGDAKKHFRLVVASARRKTLPEEYRKLSFRCSLTIS